MKKLITSFCDAKVSIFVGLHLDVAADIDKTASLFDICQMEGGRWRVKGGGRGARYEVRGTRYEVKGEG